MNIDILKRRIKKTKNMYLMVILVLLVSYIASKSSNFFSIENITQLVIQMTELCIITIGMSICILSGGFDLSMGSLVGLGTICISLMLVAELSLPFIMIITLIILLFFGFLNGIIIGYFKINPLLTTLGTSTLIMGVSLIFSKGTAISGLPEYFSNIAYLRFFGIPSQAFILIVVILSSKVLLEETRWGRHLHLIGNNKEAARYCGIDVSRNLVYVYLFTALMSFIVSFILTSRISTGRADIGSSLVLQSISASILGGVDVNGGSGNIIGAVLGVLIFAIISNGFNLLGYSKYLEQFLFGALLIITIAIRSKVVKS
ncbi:MAG: ABC transporter permease [Tissierellia bacterium]|nr:ABC transporter permease [Tissierellia bacterium]